MRIQRAFLRLLPGLLPGLMSVCLVPALSGAVLPLTVNPLVPVAPFAGQTVNVSVKVADVNPMTGATLTVTLPAGNGNPVTFTPTTIAANAGMGNRTVIFVLPKSLSTSATITGATLTINANIGGNTCTGSVVFNISPPPVISNVSPGAGSVGTTVNGVQIKLRNTAWSPALPPPVSFTDRTGTTFFGTSTAFNAATQTITANVNIPSSVAPGAYTVCSIPSGVLGAGACPAGQPSLGSGFIVTAGPALSFSLISPNVAPQCGSSIPIGVTGVGTHFTNGSGPVANFGDGISLTPVIATDDTHASVNVTVDCLAPVGPRTVTFVTGGEFAVATNGFTVASSAAKILTVTPNTGTQGQNLSVAITGLGTNWVQGGTRVNFGAGIIVGNVTVSSPTNLTASISIAPNATLGPSSITATTNGEVAAIANGFSVTAAVTPRIVSVTPTTAAQGATGIVITVDVAGMTFPAAPTFDFGSNISATAAFVNGTRATATISIQNTAIPGTRAVMMTSGPTNLSFSFSVLPNAATISTVTPAALVSGGTFRLTLTGTGTNWVQGVTTVLFGGGTVNRVTINGPASATVDVTVAKTTSGTFQLTFTTGGEQATLPGGIPITACVPSLSLSPSTAQVGATVPITFQTSCTTFGAGTFATIDGQGVSMPFTSFPVGLSSGSATFAVTATAPAAPAQTCSNRTVTLTVPGAPAQVLTAPFCVTSSPAALTRIVPGHGALGSTFNVAITGINTHFGPLTTLSFGPGITVGGLTAGSGTSLGATITIAPGATTGWRSAYVNTPTPDGPEQVQIGFFVDPPGAAAAATLLSIVPSQAAQGQSLVTVTVTGSGTTFTPAPTSTLFLGQGITVANWTPIDLTHATAVISVDPRTPVGTRGVEVVTPFEDATGPSFSVTEGIAAITSVSPVVGGHFALTQGQIANFSMIGASTNFQQGATTVDFGPGVTVNSVTVTDATHLSGQVVVSNSSPAGLRGVTVTTLGEVAKSASDAVVVSISQPSGLTMTPTSVQQGTTVAIQVQGIGTSWVNGVSTASFGNNNGLTVTSFIVNNATQQGVISLTVSGTAYPTIPYGNPLPYDLTITTQAGAAIERDVLVRALTVAPGAAILTNVTPSAGVQGSTTLITVTGQSTNFKQGVTQAMFVQGSCPGDWFAQADLNVTNVTVGGLTSATLSIAVGSTATTGLRTLCLFTQGESAGFGNAFTVLPGTPTLNLVSPVGAQQGQTLTLNLGGQFTHFTKNSIVSFGPGITTVGPAVFTDLLNISQTIAVSPLAPTGLGTVTVTTNNEIVSGKFFTVTASGAVITTVAPSSANTGSRNVFVTVNGNGTNWAEGQTQFQITGGDIHIDGFQVTGTNTAIVEMTIPANATPGPRTIYMSTGGEILSKVGGFLVTGGLPAITCANPATLTSGTFGNNVQLCGAYTTWTSATTHVTSNNVPALTVLPSTTVNNNTSITAVLDVAAGTLGLQTITVQTGSQILTTTVNVVAPVGAVPPVPFISYQSIGQGLGGQTLDVSFSGKNTKWQARSQAAPTTIAFGAGITVNSFQVGSPTSATANITIAPNAGLGTRTVTFSTGESTTFAVTAGVPAITLVDPSTLIQGQTRSFEVVGQFTSFTPGVAGTVFTACPGVAVVGLPTISGSTSATITLTASPTATVGGCVLTATTTTGAGIEVAQGVFYVSPGTAVITTVLPNTALQSQIVPGVNLVAFGTHWDNSTTFDFGSGITAVVTAFTPTTATVTLTIAPLAPTGIHTVTATTAGETAVLNNAFIVQPGTPVLLSITPTSVAQNGQFSIGILGQATTFIVPGTTVNLGAGVNVLTTLATSLTSLTVTGIVDPIAAVGLRDVTVTFGGGQVVRLFGALNITQGPAAINSASPAAVPQGAGPTNITVTGLNTHFTRVAPVADFGPGVTVTNVAVVTDTVAVVTVTVAPLAAIGLHNITMTTGGEVATGSGVFTVLANTPIITFVSPNSGRQGQTLTVTISGFNTNFALPVTFGADVVVNSAITLPTTTTASITIPATAALGPRDVIVNGISLPGGFTVTSAAGTGGTFYYTNNTGGKNFSAFIADRTTGALTALTDAPYSNGTETPKKLVFSPSGQFAYALDQLTGKVGIYSMDAATGTLTSVGPPVNIGGNPVDLTFSPNGLWAYAVTAGGPIATLQVVAQSGQLATAAVSTPGTAITFSADGTHAWVLNTVTNTVAAYASNPTTGALTFSGSWPTGSNPVGMALPAAESFLYVVNSGSSDVYTYSIAANGTLTRVGTTVTAANPSAIAVVPTGQFLYTANTGGTSLGAYSINAATGLPSAIAGAPFFAGTPFDSLALDPSGTKLYGGSSAQNRLFGWALDSTGGLTVAPGSPYSTGASPTSVTAALPGAVLEMIYPNSVHGVIQGAGPATVLVKIVGHGTHFDATKTTVDLGPGFTVTSFGKVTPTFMEVTFQMDASATPGTRTLTVSTGGEQGVLTGQSRVAGQLHAHASSGSTPLEVQTLANAFTVLPPPASLTQVSPNSVVAGTSNVDITVTGLYSNFTSGARVGAVNLGSGITVNSITANSATVLTANVNVSPAAVGAAGVSVTDAVDGTITSNLPFTVVAAVKTISLTSTSLSFPTTNVGSSNGPTAVNISNTGNAPVTFGSGSLTGANTADFTVSKTCGTSLAPGATCTLNFTFVPTGAGSRSATYNLVDDATGSPHSISLSGTGTVVTRTLSLSATNATYPVTTVGASQSSTVTLTSTGTNAVTFTGAALGGTNPGDFTVQNYCTGLLNPGSLCAVVISFTPTAPGLRTATLTISDNATGGPQVVQLTGTAQAVTQIISLSSSNVAFPATNVGATSAGLLNLGNLGTGPVTFTGLSLAGSNAGDFSVVNDCPTTLNAGIGCSLEISFTPTAAGVRTASVTVTDNSNTSPHVVQLVGTGQDITKTLSFYPGTVSFGTVTVGNSTNSYFQVFNLGTGAATVSGYTLGGSNPGDFSVYQNSCPATPVYPGSNCALHITFAPTGVGARTATVTVNDDATGNPHVVTLVGFGQAAVQTLSFSVATADFGVSPLGNTTAATGILVTNNGDVPVTFNSTAIIGSNTSDFAITQNGCPSSLPPAVNCYVFVNFTPSATGARSAGLQFTDSAPDSPQTVALAGTGENVVQSISGSPQTLVFPAQVVNAGSPAQYTIATNTGDATVTFTAAQITGVNAADFAVTSNNCTTVPQVATGTCSLFVQFTPSAVGLRSATLVLNSDAANSPMSLPLFGVGMDAGSALTFSPSSVDFASIIAGSQSSSFTFTIYNNGSVPVNISGVSLSGPNASDFTLGTTGCSGALAAGSVCYQSVRFTPTGLGQKIAALQITDDSAGSPHIAGMTGTATTGTQVVSTSAIALDFGVQNAGATSATQQVGITNTGTIPTTLSGITLGGANTADFAITNNQCGAILVPGASCTVSLNFTPSAAGARSATLQIADTASGSPQTVLLTGSGQSATKVLAVTTLTVSFPAQYDGTSSPGLLAYVLSNGTAPVTFSGYAISGPNASDFAISYNQCRNGYSDRLPPAASCYVQIVFTPSAPGARSATLTFTDDATGGTHTVGLGGAGLDTTASGKSAVVTTPALAFGAANVGSTVAGQFASITSIGSAPVTFGSYTITGANAGDFAIVTNGCHAYNSDKLAPGGNCLVQVSFTPSGTGARTATLNFNDDSVVGTHAVTLTGVGQDASAASKMLVVNTPAVAFGVQNVGTTAAGQYAYVVSGGTAPVNFSGYTLGGANAADFSITGNNCHAGFTDQLPQGASCWVQVAFTPIAAGARSATLVFTDDAPGAPHVVVLTGVGQ